MDDTAIKVDQVSKDFILPHEKTNTIKGLFTSSLKVHKGAKETQHALRDISFEIKKGEFFGIVGRNGSGKSTMLKILAGIYQPTTGNIATKGRIIPFIELGVGFNGELSGRENVYLNGAILGFSRKQVDAMYSDIVAFAELEKFMDQKLKNYSSGMQVRLAFSMATRAEADILLVDEVLAVGDADFQKKCFRFFRDLKKRQKTVIFVSHDMNAVQEYCDRAMLIEKSEVVLIGSTYKVSTAYKRMFAEQSHGQTNLKTGKKRWGEKQVEYSSVKLQPQELAKENKTIQIKTEAIVKKNVDEAILGFKVRGSDGLPLLGTNTKVKRQDLKNLKKGQKLSITWDVPNVFNDGDYLVDVAIESQDYADVYDWWEEAAAFQVDRQEANPYSVHPFINLKIEES